MDYDRNTAAWWKEPQVLFLLLIVFLAHFYRLDVVSVRGEEPRRIAIGQEMLRTGDWIVPQIQGEPVFFRPPLQNWLIGLSIAAHGGTSHWSVRFPGIMAVLLTCLLLYGYGRRYLGPLGAFSAAAAYATMAQVMELGKLAETETIFTFLICATLLTWHWGFTSGWSDSRLWMTAYAVAGLGALAKGLQAPVYLLTASALYLIWSGSWRRIFTVGHALGLLTFGVVFGLWFFPYLARMGWHNSVLTVVGETTMRLDYSDHDEVIRHLWLYPLWVLSCMLPWSLFLIGYVRSDLRAALGDASPMLRFAASAILISFPTCYAIPSANARYFMPLYPCVALLVGLVIERSILAAEGTSLRRHWTWMMAGTGLVLIGLALCFQFGPAVGITSPVLDAQPSQQLLLFTLATAALGCLILFYRRAVNEIPIMALAILFALTGSVVCQNMVRFNSIEVESPVAALKEKVPDDAPFYSFGPVNHRFAYYFDRPIRVISWTPPQTDLPSIDSYFCFEVDRPEKGPPSPLAFNWKKVGILWMDRYPHQKESFVIVGQRILP